jgi:hypothetical protein
MIVPGSRFGLRGSFVNGRKLARRFGVVRHPDCATRQKIIGVRVKKGMVCWETDALSPFFTLTPIIFPDSDNARQKTPNRRASLNAPLLFTKVQHRPNLLKRGIQQNLFLESRAVEGAAGSGVRNNKGTLSESHQVGVSASTVRVRKNWGRSMIFAV